MKAAKKFGSLFLCTIIMLSLSVGAFATFDTPLSTPLPEEQIINAESGINPRVKTSFDFDDLGVNRYKADKVTYYIDGTEVLWYNVTWTPSGQNLKIAFRNVQDGEFYFVELSGGSATGGIRLLGLEIPEGEYQVCIINPYGSEGPISGTIQYEWD